MVERTHRISVGAVIVRNNRILLTRYRDRNGNIYLVCPGGGVNVNERLLQAVEREVKEETGLEISPGKILFVEDMYSRRYRMVKVWFLCRVTGGTLRRTRGAVDEAIIDVKWYRHEELSGMTVYPRAILEYAWNAFFKDGWETKYLDSGYADF